MVGCSNCLYGLPYPTDSCKHHQDKESSIHQFLWRRNCCHWDCSTVGLHKRKLSPELHPYLQGQPITMWGTLIMQPSNHIHSSTYIIYFIINWARYNPPYTTFMRVSGHQWIILWRSTFALPQKQNLPTSQDFDWSTADKMPQRWCTNCSTPLKTSPVAKGSSSSDWTCNWSYVSMMSASRTHTTTLTSWMPSERCY